MQEIDKSSSGLFIDRLNKDTEDISGIFMEYTYWTSYAITNIGVLVAILVLNRYLFVYALITAVTIFFINKKRISKQYEIQKKVKKLKDLLRHMLDKNPKKRYTFQKIVRHPWLKPYTEKIFSEEDLLVPSQIYPADRYKAS